MDSPTFSSLSHRKRSLYVHVPFCRHRCGYCNFTLIAGRDHLIERYLQALNLEINWLDQPYPVHTLFFGGGTPSQLTPDQFEQLFEIVASQFEIVQPTEISVECNPNDMTRDLARRFQSLGVNRISFGIQSFNPRKLKFLERTHTAEDIQDAVQLAASVTDNVSFDLIFATQNESLKEWSEDLHKAVSLNPTHLSMYELTIEKGTQFWNRQAKQKLRIPGENHRTDQYLLATELLAKQGFEHYEISSFARPGFKCRHNLGYWQGHEYFAFGPGASRFIDAVRETNHRSTTNYLKLVEAGCSPAVDQQRLSRKDVAVDRLVFGLRILEGIEMDSFQSSTGFCISELIASRPDLEANGLISMANGICKLTPKGLLLYDSISDAIFHAN